MLIPIGYIILTLLIFFSEIKKFITEINQHFKNQIFLKLKQNTTFKKINWHNKKILNYCTFNIKNKSSITAFLTSFLKHKTDPINIKYGKT